MQLPYQDVRVAVIGDSFVQGVRDPRRLGWVGQLPLCVAQRLDLTVYNLGVRRDTSNDIASRWQSEASMRLKDGDAYGVCFSFGVNDTTQEGQSTRVPLDRSVKNPQEILRSARASGWSSLFLGPPPIADNAQNERMARIDHAYSAVAADEGVTYTSTFMALTANSVWMEQVAQEDGAHPANEGYVAYA